MEEAFKEAGSDKQVDLCFFVSEFVYLMKEFEAPQTSGSIMIEFLEGRQMVCLIPTREKDNVVWCKCKLALRTVSRPQVPQLKLPVSFRDARD